MNKKYWAYPMCASYNTETESGKKDIIKITYSNSKKEDFVSTEEVSSSLMNTNFINSDTMIINLRSNSFTVELDNDFEESLKIHSYGLINKDEIINSFVSAAIEKEYIYVPSTNDTNIKIFKAHCTVDELDDMKVSFDFVNRIFSDELLDPNIKKIFVFPSELRFFGIDVIIHTDDGKEQKYRAYNVVNYNNTNNMVANDDNNMYRYTFDCIYAGLIEDDSKESRVTIHLHVSKEEEDEDE